MNRCYANQQRLKEDMAQNIPPYLKEDRETNSFIRAHWN